MPDDRSRLARFEGEVRTDIAIGERMYRFALALQKRICREIEAAEPSARFAIAAGAGPALSSLVLEEGIATRRAVVIVARLRRGDAMATGLTVDLLQATHGGTEFSARLHHVAPVDVGTVGWFEGAVAIEPASAHGERFEAFWRAVADRHADIVDYDAMSAAHRAGAAADTAGFRFDAVRDPDGTGEKTFLFVRDVGRALLAAWTLVGRV